MTQLTRQQAAAIEQYRKAGDFNAYLFAVVALNDAGLYEAEAIGHITKEETKDD